MYTNGVHAERCVGRSASKKKKKKKDKDAVFLSQLKPAGAASYGGQIHRSSYKPELDFMTFHQQLLTYQTSVYCVAVDDHCAAILTFECSVMKRICIIV